MSDVRSAAYDRIDRFLRDNLDDRDYAPYAEALDVLWEPPPAQVAVIEAAKAFRDAETACVTAYGEKEDVEWARKLGSTLGAWMDAKVKIFDAVTTLCALEEDA